MINGINPIYNPILNSSPVSNQELDTRQERVLKQTGQIQCATCANRKYQDGSDEMVSFKAPAHISPEGSAAAVMSHEREHVANAYSKAIQKDGKVLQATVTLHTAVCPECGKSYVSGGTTSTMISHPKDDPYSQNSKSNNYEKMSGKLIDLQI